VRARTGGGVVTRAPEVLAAAVLALVAGAAVVVATRARPAPAASAASADFQRLVHGLGGGAAIDASRCARAFDPRMDDVCDRRADPTPAGDRFCPHGLASTPGR
jgi:hypothetical protein